jgi:hypothetical protein
VEERALVDDALRAGPAGARLCDALGLAPGSPCHVVDAKYEAGSSCTVLYEVGDRLLITVMTFAGDPPAGGVDLGDGARVFEFPYDPKLPGLAAVLDGSALAGTLDVPTDRLRVRLLRYRPGKRATVAIEVRAGDAPARTLIGKVYAKPEKAAAVHEEAGRLAPALAGSPVLTLAPPAGFLPEVPMVLWQPVAGTDFESALDASDGAGPLAAAAAAVAAVHAAPVVSRRLRPVDAELSRFRSRAGNIARVAPEEGKVLVRVAAAVADAGAGIDHPEPGLVHGDCKPSQFRVTARGVALLDFDHCGVADPASDVGTFLASLRQRDRGALEEPFLRAYLAAAGSDDGMADRARWYEAVALTRKALRAFARAPRSPIPGILAGEALRCLES